MRAAIYRLRGIQKAYGERKVLDIEELEIWEGESLALVGPSGAGKSTLLRILNFLEDADAGSICFREKQLGKAGEVAVEDKRRVTTVFQKPVLLDRTVYDNVRMGLSLRGERDGREAVMQALQAVGLEKLAKERARTLSGGEAQRVALARAIVIGPAVLLLDEPTANLDPYHVGVIERIVQAVHAQGTTIVWVTHNIFQARRIAQRVGLMLDGRLVELNYAPEFFDNPQDERTRAFLKGEMVC